MTEVEGAVEIFSSNSLLKKETLKAVDADA